jgi:hypothetical protein
MRVYGSYMYSKTGRLDFGSSGNRPSSLFENGTIKSTYLGVSTI